MMKRTKKLLSAALALALTFALGVPALAQSQTIAAPTVVLEKTLLNGKELATGSVSAQMEGEILMLPVRQVAEALGFTVTWIPADKGVELNDGIVKTKIYIGSDSYYMASATAIGMSRPDSLGAAPVLADGKTYVPAALFTLLYGKDSAVAVEDQTLKITRGDHLLKSTIKETRVDGVSVNIVPFTVCFDGKNKLVPMETLAELLSFEVTAVKEENAYQLDNGTAKTTIYMDVDSYFKASSKAIGMTCPVQLGSAPVTVGETVYVPAALFDLLCGEGTITLDDVTMLVKTK